MPEAQTCANSMLNQCLLAKFCFSNSLQEKLPLPACKGDPALRPHIVTAATDSAEVADINLAHWNIHTLGEGNMSY